MISSQITMRPRSALPSSRFPSCAQGVRALPVHNVATSRRVACKFSDASGAVASEPLTQRIFAQLDALEGNVPQSRQGAIGGAFAALQAAEEKWAKLKAGAETGPAPGFVCESTDWLEAAPDFDVVVCGGVLGIFAAAALARRGLRVAVLERGPLRGVGQEWNSCWKDLLELEHEGLVTREELEACVNVEVDTVRMSFAWQPPAGGGAEVMNHGSSNGQTEASVRDVMNLVVSAETLILLVRRKFEDLGGVVIERTALDDIKVHPNGCSLSVRPDGETPAATLTARLVLDCMGHSSPIVRQARWGSKPDGVVLVVGTHGSGFVDDGKMDLLLTNTQLQPQNAKFNMAQYFFQSIPSGSGPTDRITYMFTYVTPEEYRPPLSAMVEDYWRLMPEYKGVRLEDIIFKRVHFGVFPTYKNSPLKPAFDRVFQIGLASSLQSPLTFAGFGNLARHLNRLTTALQEALDIDALDRESLGLVQAYSPELSSSFLLQKAMRVEKGQQPRPEHINRMMSGNFRAMTQLGEEFMKPFLQDTYHFGGIAQAFAIQFFIDPGSVPLIVGHVGGGPIMDWAGHMANMAIYETLHSAATTLGLRSAVASASLLTPRQRFSLNRLLDAWEYGSGQDYYRLRA